MQNNTTKIYQSPTIVLGFILFLALVIGTIYRVNTAFETNPGLVNVDAYKTGRDYGKSRHNAQHLAALGYKLDLITNNFIESDKEFEYIAKLTHNNIAIKNAQVKFYFYRQLEKEFDFETDASFDGKNWVSSAKLPRKGKWLIVAYASFDNKELQAFKKIFVNNAL